MNEFSQQVESPASPTGDGSIAAVLNRLRRRIRRYAWTEGLATAVAAVAIAFWVSLAFDWVFEPSIGIRIVFLAAAAAVVVVIFVSINCQTSGQTANRSQYGDSA